MRNPKYTRICAVCGKEFQTSYKNAKYCNNICKLKRESEKRGLPKTK